MNNELIAQQIRDIQEDILKMRIKKGMIPKMSIIYDIIDEKWEVDRIEAIRGGK